MIPMLTPELEAALNAIAAIVHANAREKGFHPDNETIEEFIPKTVANIHGEASELWEAFRKGKLHHPCDKDCGLTCQEEEIADIIIRGFDTANRLGINVGAAIAKKHAYNTTRPYRHGDKAA